MHHHSSGSLERQPSFLPRASLEVATLFSAVVIELLSDSSASSSINTADRLALLLLAYAELPALTVAVSGHESCREDRNVPAAAALGCQLPFGTEEAQQTTEEHI